MADAVSAMAIVPWLAAGIVSCRFCELVRQSCLAIALAFWHDTES